MKVLSFESSCDETSVAVVEGEGERVKLLSLKTATQIETHKLYGGVVPEIASRAHTEALKPLCDMALSEAGLTVKDIDLIAVTCTPGLIGALLTGVSFAKALAYANGIPFIGVDHIKGHVAANFLAYPGKAVPGATALVASGGHTSLLNIKSYTDFELIGSARDDAAGEAFDKIARVLGIPYPGGAEMDELASKGDPDKIKFPSPAISDGSLDFSFSGLKTAVINFVHNSKQRGLEISREDIAASVTRAVVDALTEKTRDALERYNSKRLFLAGGVAANSHLRRSMEKLCEKMNVEYYCSPPELCGDNGAMIGAMGYYEYLAGNRSDISLNADAGN